MTGGRGYGTRMIQMLRDRFLSRVVVKGVEVKKQADGGFIMREEDVDNLRARGFDFSLLNKPAKSSRASD